jgi:NAD(P)-dependent dehydrogenase (short-subunit alcohol dehydrogenase family)
MFQPDLLKDKVIVITGGGTGLGRAMGERFLQLGAKLAIASRREPVLRQAADEMMAACGGEVLPLVCDVRDPEAVEKMMEAAWSHYGGIDVLVNNAAGNFASPTERLSPRAVDSVLNIVLHGTFYCTLAAGKRWIASQRRGRILNIVATYVQSGSAYVVPSAAAKAGVMALTRSLAVEWGKHNITTVAIAPGPFPTEGAWSRLMPPGPMADMAINRIPLKRVGRHEELANLASYLLSDMAEYINGDCIVIDGGEWLKGAGQFSWLEMLSDEDWARLAMQARQGK